MIRMINELFESYNYIANNVSDDLYLATDESSAKTVFWLVIQESDLGSLVDKQSELFDACKQVNKNSALDKNISMLVLWETGGDLDIGEMKKKIMMVEEDPYFFKKHVLYFSSEEYDSLKTAMGEESLHNFLQKNIALQDVFVKYKENPLSQGWQPLLYRIAIKMPFVDFNIGFSDGLASLFENNEERIKASSDKQLVEFDHSFFEILNTRTSNEIKDADVSSEKYLAELLPALEGKGDGD